MARTQNSNVEKIQKIMPLLLRLEKNKNNYFPEAVALGPYHHGEPELASVEAFKPRAVDLFISNGPGDEEEYYNKVVDIIGDIRNCYEQSSTDKYSDEDLARMMLRDACLIIIFMEVSVKAEPELEYGHPIMEKLSAMKEHLGMLTIMSLSRDLILLENQIPLRVIELLVDFRYGGDAQNECLLTRYVDKSIFGEIREESKSIYPSLRPLHLLEAMYMLLVSDCAEKKDGGVDQEKKDGGDDQEKKDGGDDPENGAPPNTTNRNHGILCRLRNTCACACKEAAKQNITTSMKNFTHSFRSATNLKTKGIYFRPSPTQSLRDVSFKSYFFYSGLQLPVWYVTRLTKVFFMNLIAYELSPKCELDYGPVVSYIDFMKSLIERAEDVKELREKKILNNMLSSEEEVLNVYKEINTYGANDLGVFLAVKNKIQAHCNSRIKMWMAELIHANFRSPWTLIAFLAAVALLAISAAQLYYAVHPNN